MLDQRTLKGGAKSAFPQSRANRTAKILPLKGQPPPRRARTQRGDVSFGVGLELVEWLSMKST